MWIVLCDEVVATKMRQKVVCYSNRSATLFPACSSLKRTKALGIQNNDHPSSGGESYNTPIPLFAHNYVFIYICIYIYIVIYIICIFMKSSEFR